MTVKMRDCWHCMQERKSHIDTGLSLEREQVKIELGETPFAADKFKVDSNEKES